MFSFDLAEVLYVIERTIFNIYVKSGVLDTHIVPHMN